jgi:NAD(P)H-hydrate epimerase
MKYLVSGKEMKLLDQNTSGHFMVPEEVLMEQAAQGFVRKLLSLGYDCKRFLIVCGGGNNGADGIAAARILNQMGYHARIYQANPKAKESRLFQLQKNIYETYGYPVLPTLTGEEDVDCIVDAIFGIGLSRNVTGSEEKCIELLNRMTAKKIALDIASGVSADTGEILGTAFRADDTITFSFGKIGQYLWPGNEYSGNVHVVRTGITQESFLERKPKTAAMEWADLSNLPKRQSHSNKGSYGKLLVIAGSADMAGAAYFSAAAAYRCGCGLVRIFTAQENAKSLHNLLPEAILSTYDKRFDPEKLIADLKWADAIVLGPGIGTSENARNLLHTVLKNAAVPLLLDADALNLLADEPKLLLGPHTDLVVTPHLGEMARLSGDTVSLIQTRLFETAQDFAKEYDVVCVLKDFRTVTAVPYGLNYMNLSGNHGMATAGSGDVLTGVIGAYLAAGIPAALAAPLGVYVHGLAGDFARSQKGAAALMASDIIDGLVSLSGKVDKEHETE